MNFRLISVTLAAVLLVGCAQSADTHQAQEHYDPLEKFNRKMFAINYNILDPYVLRPIAETWRDYVPAPARTGLNNFFSNLNEPAAMLNAFLCGDVYRGMLHFNRFFLNSLLGIGGFIDVAEMANSKLSRENDLRFGATLGKYGISYGPYLMLPVYGNFTLREDVGNYVDHLYPALSWLTLWLSATKWLLEGVEKRARLLDSDAILHNSKDPYALMRNAYFQHHDFLATDGKLQPQKNSNASAIEGNLNEIDAE